LSEHRGDARPDTLIGLKVSDVDAVEAEFGRPTGVPDRNSLAEPWYGTVNG
jgi:hypothetical protein